IIDNNMSLQELRFFSIYLSKINARNVSTRCVRFSLSDFQKIMNIGKMNIRHFKKSINCLLCKVVHIPTDNGGLSSFQLFKKVNLFKDDTEKWFVEIDAHDDALPLFFNLKGNYFSYELWNALRLKSVNQLRMYELLKQRENLGKFEIKISELRKFLFINPDEYNRLVDFKNRILDSCQKALSENTDICYTYECGKRGSRGKWLTIIFHIYANKNYKDPMGLDEFIDKQSASQSEHPLDERPQPSEHYQPESSSSALSRQSYLSGEFERDLAPADIKVLCDMLACKVPSASECQPEPLEKRLRLLYSQMLIKSKEPIRNPVTYLVSCINHLDPDNLPPISIQDDDDEYGKFFNNF
ncbi:MAG: replication initiation protein, partial [Oscillospiraceae bacterium]|nr:replication initiation protein [Oscillospiraceae bacterium]